jgi:hypothetical protein
MLGNGRKMLGNGRKFLDTVAFEKIAANRSSGCMAFRG